MRVQTGPDGTPQATAVTSELETQAIGFLLDKTDVTGIADVSGADDYSRNGKTVIWTADDETVSYIGSTRREAPIRLSVSYELDNEPVKAADLAGKSGRVRMCFSYENATHETVSGGEDDETSVCVPFACATAFLLDTDKFSNVEVDGGKMIELAGRTVVAGYGLPGFADSLGIDLDEADMEVEIPEGFSVEADVADFSLGQTTTVATCELFSGIDAEKLDTSDIDKTPDTLQSSMNRLVDGGDTLSDGLAKLAAGGNTLESGAERLEQGAENLASGARSLGDSASALPSTTSKLADGTESLAQGVETLSGGLSTLGEKA